MALWKTRLMAITGAHVILYTDDAAADRAFFADVLGLKSVDAGGGWLIFALPPAELAAHPASADGGDYELYLMCDDIEATVRELEVKGVEFSTGVTQQRWGLITTIVLPGGIGDDSGCTSRCTRARCRPRADQAVCAARVEPSTSGAVPSDEKR